MFIYLKKYFTHFDNSNCNVCAILLRTIWMVNGYHSLTFSSSKCEFSKTKYQKKSCTFSFIWHRGCSMYTSKHLFWRLPDKQFYYVTTALFLVKTFLKACLFSKTIILSILNYWRLVAEVMSCYFIVIGVRLELAQCANLLCNSKLFHRFWSFKL